MCYLQPAQRIPTLRRNVKTAADASARIYFNLKPGDSDKGRWLQQEDRYIYPNDYTVCCVRGNIYCMQLIHGPQKEHVDGGKPYGADVFIDILRVTFFKASSSLGFRLIDQFTSSLLDKPDEKAIPAPMLALIATAVRI